MFEGKRPLKVKKWNLNHYGTKINHVQEIMIER